MIPTVYGWLVVAARGGMARSTPREP